ncbi:hypothetical protein [Providencia sneebia]|uniref:Uncharacterized protein n=1 Tax=Providencia sneebia DSM 19967 TaxID=1141660 RepID=K8WQR3_9GAMM|nr:hypothetical protein [Providencia sneebia]EKT58480.1 hypothetical protein OO7_07159 [Providencia sneebia DSM 19967]
MNNTEIYGIEKINKAYRLRLQEIESCHTSGERMSRIMAWNAFINDQVRLDDTNSSTDKVASLKYMESIELNDGDIGISEPEFINYFFDETCVINKRVTQKKVKFVFYLFLTLAAYGIYAIFFK